MPATGRSASLQDTTSEQCVSPILAPSHRVDPFQYNDTSCINPGPAPKGFPHVLISSVLKLDILPIIVSVDCDPFLLARLDIISVGRIIAGFVSPRTYAVLCQRVRLVTLSEDLLQLDALQSQLYWILARGKVPLFCS